MTGTPEGSMIIAGLDGSEASKDALRWAVGHGKRLGATVRAIAVWHHPVQFGYPRVLPDREFEEQAERWVRDAVAEVGGAEPGCAVESEVVNGHPPRELIEASADADLLVLGHRGRGGVVGMLIGSVVLQCVQHARCPVVVVRPDR